jgi:hypothetical protein
MKRIANAMYLIDRKITRAISKMKKIVVVME